MSKHIILTRALRDSIRVQQALALTSEEVSVIPLWNIEYHYPPISTQQHVIITSRHALHVLDKASINHETIFYVVGIQTKQELAALGYANVEHFVDVEVLLNHIPHQVDDVLYLRGEHVAVDIKERFLKRGKHVQEVIVYSNQFDEDHAEAFLAACDAHDDIILPVFSLRTGISISELIRKHSPELFKKIELIGMSQHITENLTQYPWKKMHYLRSADLHSVTDAIMLARSN